MASSPRLDKPHRLPTNEALDVLATDERDVLPEALLINPDQLAAVFRFLGGHAAEDVRAAGVVCLERRGEILVNSPILLLERNRQGEDFTFAEVVKSPLHRSALRWSACIVAGV